LQSFIFCCCGVSTLAGVVAVAALLAGVAAVGGVAGGVTAGVGAGVAAAAAGAVVFRQLLINALRASPARFWVLAFALQVVILLC